MIIDLRGTHGSGKSWIVHSLLASEGGGQSLTADGVCLGHLLPSVDCAVLGRYATACGGCDQIKTQGEVCRRVRLLSARYAHTLLEGILVSHTFARYDSLAKEMEALDRPYTFAFLDTPLDVCIARVRARRIARGNLRPLDPRNIVKDWHRIWSRVRAQVRAAGHHVVEIPYLDPLPVVRSLFK